MERWQNRVAVVTGASSGIGAAVVIDLAKAGLRVVGLARRVERVQDLKKGLSKVEQDRIHAVKCDVGNEKSVQAAFDWIIKTLGGVDIMINNAGIALPGKLATMDTSSIRQIVDTNIMGVVYCTQHAFKSMTDRKFDGHVIVVNSILGHSTPVMPPTVEMNIYPSTKHAITAITEIYRQEFQGLGTRIKITSISPGLVDTEIVRDEIKDYFKNAILRPEDISQGILYAISTPPHVQVHELTIKPVGEKM